MDDKLTRKDIQAAAVVLRAFPVPAHLGRDAMARVSAWLDAMPGAEALSTARNYAILGAIQDRIMADYYDEGLRRRRLLSESAELDVVAAWLERVG
jgi:hypothetical protein